ncbi:hypothetical protein QTP88_011717 [Uroleucon formosanum]
MLYESNHVFGVQELKLIDGLSVITGSVVRQTSVTLEPYKVKLELDGLRNVKNASCQFAAGAGSCCKHIAAVMIFINNDEGTSKTNEPQVWGKPSKFGENLYKKGKTISELFPQKRLSIPCSVSRNIYEEERTEIDRICSKTLFNIIDTIDGQLEIEKNAVHLFNLIKKQAHNEASNYSKFPLICHVSIKQIFNQTLDQSQNNFWLEYRKLRISASSKAHKIKTLKSTSDESKNKLAIYLINEMEIKGKGASNVLYGLQTENKAFTLFSSSYNVDVIKSGLIIHSSKPWICASPDGLILRNGEIISVLEIKCPSSCKKKPIIDPSTGIPNLSYLQISNEEIVLKTSHRDPFEGERD